VASVYSSRGEPSRGIEILQRCVELAERNLDGELPLPIRLALVMSRSGDLLQASQHLKYLAEHLQSVEEGAWPQFTSLNL
jgi:hypothetical protein